MTTGCQGGDFPEAPRFVPEERSRVPTRQEPDSRPSVAAAPGGPFTPIRDVERRVTGDAGTGEALVRLDRKITDRLNLVHERTGNLSKDIRDSRADHADLRTELKGDIAEIKDMIRARDARAEEANRELAREIRALREPVWVLALIIFSFGIGILLNAAPVATLIVLAAIFVIVAIVGD